MTDTNIPQNSISETKRSALTDQILMLCVPLIVAIFTQGFSAIINVATSLISCVFISTLGKKIAPSEFSPKFSHLFIIGTTVALLLPVSAPRWIIVLTAVFAMAVCVLPFGGPEKTPFIPSVTAICFATLCWPEEIYNYSEIGESLGKMLLYGNSVDDNVVAVLEALVGSVPSALGTGCILALSGSLIFLLIRRPKDSISSFSFILAVFLMSILFPRVATGRVISAVMELCSGMIFFGSVFFISSPVFAPKRTISKFFWGLTSGVICMLIRYVSPLEEGACFGFIIACSLSDLFDNLPLTHKEKKLKKDLEPYIETEIITVVPGEILNEIPDMSAEEIVQQEKDSEETKDDVIVSEENTITEQAPPFIIGGDHDE